MNRPWIFLSNTFLTVTDGSYRTCKKIADYTLNALEGQIADPFFAGLHANLLPLVSNFNALYINWKQQLGHQKSKTNALTLNLKTLQGEKIGFWDINIQMFFPQGSTEYIALLPNRRAPFQNGSQEDRIAAVGALAQAMAPYQQLNTVKADVTAFFTLLTTNFNTQKQDLSHTNVSSTALDHAREAVCIELYGTLGLLMNHFRANPVDADNYFDTESIRNHEQTLFKSNLAGGELKLALTHTFIIDEEVRFVNRGNTEIRFALCTEANDAIGQPSISVPPMDEVIVRAQELGDVMTQRFLKAENINPTEEGKYTIMLL